MEKVIQRELWVQDDSVYAHTCGASGKGIC